MMNEHLHCVLATCKTLSQDVWFTSKPYYKSKFWDNELKFKDIGNLNIYNYSIYTDK